MAVANALARRVPLPNVHHDYPAIAQRGALYVELVNDDLHEAPRAVAEVTPHPVADLELVHMIAPSLNDESMTAPHLQKHNDSPGNPLLHSQPPCKRCSR